jgi:hypothetical protein
MGIGSATGGSNTSYKRITVLIRGREDPSEEAKVKVAKCVLTGAPRIEQTNKLHPSIEVDDVKTFPIFPTMNC